MRDYQRIFIIIDPINSQRIDKFFKKKWSTDEVFVNDDGYAAMGIQSLIKCFQRGYFWR